MPRTSRTELERSQRMVLDDAARLASLEGLESLTLGRVAGRAGLSKSGLIGRFGTKRALQLAAIESARATVIREVVEPAMREPRGLPRLRAFVDAYLDYLRRDVFPGGCVLAAAAHEMDGRPGPVRDAVRDQWADWLAMLAREARHAGFPDPEQTAFELHALMLTANWANQLFEDEAALERARHGIERVLAG